MRLGWIWGLPEHPWPGAQGWQHAPLSPPSPKRARARSRSHESPKNMINHRLCQREGEGEGGRLPAQVFGLPVPRDLRTGFILCMLVCPGQATRSLPSGTDWPARRDCNSWPRSPSPSHAHSLAADTI